MKRYLITMLVGSVLLTGMLSGCESVNVPQTVNDSFRQKYSQAKEVSWEKEKGNYEANWGGKDGEANSVTFTPSGSFVEIVKAIPTRDLPQAVLPFVKEHYKNAKFGDVGRVLDAKGKTTYELEISGKDVIFDENGNFLKEEK